MATLAGRLRPYGLHLALLAYTPVVLGLAAYFRSPGAQVGLGLATFAVLALCSRTLEPAQRRQVWICVVVATGFEVLGSQIWGVYRYRLGWIPPYVPPGHGLVYFFGLTAAQLPIFQRHGRRASIVVLLACCLYVLLGLSVLPTVTHRWDVQGALCLPVLAWCILRSRRHALFAAIFIATLDLELCGTLAGDWRWLAEAPITHVPSGNPPSAIAGGYCIIDGTVLAVSSLLGRLRPRPQEASEAAAAPRAARSHRARLASPP